MTLAQRCDEIIRMIDEVLAAEASAELGLRGTVAPDVALSGVLGRPGAQARR